MGDILGVVVSTVQRVDKSVLNVWVRRLFEQPSQARPFRNGRAVRDG
tara:strand:+ start:7692 stop:7832 length:141 start_codon:yes stop_codon:yes gene_type:complete